MPGGTDIAQKVMCRPQYTKTKQSKRKNGCLQKGIRSFFCCGRPGTDDRPGPAGINGTGKLRRLSSVLLSSRSLGGLALLDCRADCGGHQRRNGQHDEDNGNGVLPNRLGGPQQVNTAAGIFLCQGSEDQAQNDRRHSKVQLDQDKADHTHDEHAGKLPPDSGSMRRCL